METGVDERLPRVNAAGEPLPDWTLGFQGDKSGVRVSTVTFLEWRLDVPEGLCFHDHCQGADGHLTQYTEPAKTFVDPLAALQRTSLQLR